MRRAALIAFLVLPLAVLGAAQSGPVTERLPNTTFGNYYPRWLGWTAVSPGVNPYSGIVSSAYVSGLSVAVDSRGQAHAVVLENHFHSHLGESFFYMPYGKYYHVGYSSGRAMDSGPGTGFSDAFIADNTYGSLVTTADDEFVSDPDICVDPNDNIHLAWVHEFTSESTPRWDIYYRAKGPGGWGTTYNLTYADSDNLKYEGIRIRVGNDGLIHVIAHCTNLNIAPDGNGRRPLSQTMVHLVFNGSSVTMNPLPGTTWTETGAATPRLAINAANQLCAVWTETYYNENDPGSSDTWTDVYVATYAGTWSAKSLIGEPGALFTVSNSEPYATYDSSGFVHFVYTKLSIGTGARTLRYRKGAGSITEPSSPSTDVQNGAVLLDTRGQIHCVWKTTAGDLGYAARVKNPDPAALSLTWYQQLPAIAMPTGIPTGDTRLGAAAISTNDVIHVAGERYWTSTFEYGLGARDGASMFGVCPGTLANAASGNVMFNLPLFAAAGAGPSTACSLVHNTLDNMPSAIARGWRFNLDMRVLRHWLGGGTLLGYGAADTATLVFPDGRAIQFSYSPTYGYLVAQDEYGYFGRIEYTDPPVSGEAPEYRLTTKNGGVLTFNNGGRLKRIQDPDGNYLDITWNYWQIVEPASNGYTQYDRIVHIASVQDMLGNAPGTRSAATFTYEAVSSAIVNPRPDTITDPGGKRYKFNYSVSGDKLVSVVWADGPFTPGWEFEYSAADNPATKERVNHLRRILPPRGRAANPKYGYTLGYLPDGRFASVADPVAPVLAENADDMTPPVNVSAQMSVLYDETISLLLDSQIIVTDRRGFNTRFFTERRRSLATGIQDQASINGDPGIFMVVRTFDTYGNVLNIRDRWGKDTSFTYHSTAVPAYVRDNLNEVRRPNPSGAGQTLVAAYTWTVDGLNNVDTATTYATPTEGPSAVARVTDHDYNQFGQLTQVKYPDVTRPDGAQQTTVVTAFEYAGPRRQLTKVTNEEGHSATFSSFDAVCGFPQSALRDGGTQPEETLYTAMGYVWKTKRPQGAAGNDAPGWSEVLRDGMYRVTYSIDPAGKITTFGYDLDSHLTSVLPPVGGIVTTTYDARGIVDGGAGPDGAWLQWVDAAGNVRRVNDVRGFETNRNFDFAGRVIETRVPGGSTVAGGGGGGGPALHTTQFAYDQFDGTDRWMTVTQTGSPANRVTKSFFDNRGRVKQVLAPDLTTKQESFYDELDQTVAQQLVYGSTVQSCSLYFRDARDRVHRVRQQDTPYGSAPTNQRSAYTLYNKAGAVVTTVDPLGDVTGSSYAHKTTYVLDVRERVQFVVDGKGVTVAEYVYGDDDLVAEVKVPDPETKSTALVTAVKNTYTGRKEQKRSENRDAKGVNYTYLDLPGQFSTATDPLSRVTRTTYYGDTQRVDEVIEAEGTAHENRTKHLWTNGFLTETRVWNPASLAYDAAFKRFYDKAGRLEKFEAPVVAAEKYFYNDFSEQSQSVAGTKTITHAYNSLGQRTSSVWSGSHSKTLTYGYDNAGNRNSVTDGSLQRTMTWDVWKGSPVGEVFLVGGQTWKTQTHTTDLAGNMTALLDPQGVSHGWPVDENNRPFRKDYAGVATQYQFYTPGGLLDSEHLYSGTSTLIAKTFHAYDRVGRKSRSVTTNAAGEVLTDFGWSYNDAGEMTEVRANHLNAIVGVGNDNRGQILTESLPGNGGGLNAPPFTNDIIGLPTGNESSNSSEVPGTPKVILPVPARSATYTYGPGGNRLTALIDGLLTSYTYNSANQLTNESSPGKTVSHTYDEWGNETVRTTTAGTVTTETFGYNYQNVLSSYTNSATGANWQYDLWPSGERYSKTNLSTLTKELYIPRFGDVTADYTQIGAGAINHQNSYVCGLGLDMKSTRVPASGGRKHYVGDSVGTVSMTLDDTGATAETTYRDAWGNTVAGSSTERYGFAQREHDNESGLVYVRARMYDPKLGRFTQTDPIEDRRHSAHYAYCSNDPVSRTDPLGLEDGIGHHIFPRHLWKEVFAETDDVYKYLDSTVIPLRMHNSTEHGWYNKYVEDALERYEHFIGKPLAKWDVPIAKKFVANLKSRTHVKAFIKALKVADNAVRKTEAQLIAKYGEKLDPEKLTSALRKTYKKYMKASLVGVGDKVRALLKKAVGASAKTVARGLAVVTVLSVASAAFGAESLDEANTKVKEELVWPALVEEGIKTWIADPLEEWTNELYKVGQERNSSALEAMMGKGDEGLDEDTLEEIDKQLLVIMNQQRLLESARSPNHPGRATYEKNIADARKKIKELDPKGQY